MSNKDENGKVLKKSQHRNMQNKGQKLLFQFFSKLI